MKKIVAKSSAEDRAVPEATEGIMMKVNNGED